MHHFIAADKSVLTGDVVAELLMRYALLLNQQGMADTIDFDAYTTTGVSTTVSLLLHSGVSLVAETVPSTLHEPDNARVEDYLRTRIDTLLRQQEPTNDDIAGTSVWNDPVADGSA